MVKKIKAVAIFAIATMLVIVGCNNLTTGTLSGKNIGDKATVHLSLGSISRVTLAPQTLTVDSAEIDHYVITGESKEGYTLDPTDIEKDDIEAGTASITDLALDDWTLTLYAVNSTGGKLLQGTSVCTLKSTGQDEVTFNLSSIGLNTTGSYEIVIKYEGGAWKDSYVISWGLYNELTGVPAGTLGVDGTAITDQTAENSKAIAQASGFTATATGVTPGSYTFGVYIKQGTTKLGFASEKIVIEPGRATEGELILDDNIIKTAPAAPTLLAAQLMDGSEDEDFYNVRLYWQDNAKNEESFELFIRKFTDTTSPYTAKTADAEFTPSLQEMKYDYGSIFSLDGTKYFGSGATATGTQNVIKYVSGSLFAGSEELVLSFPTGTLWDVQIRAVNSIGTSASCVRVADTANHTQLEIATPTTEAPAPTSSKTFMSSLDDKYVTGYGVGADSAWNHISMVKITYQLDGGVLTLPAVDFDSSEAVSHIFTGVNYVEYKPYTLLTDGADDAAKYIPLVEIDGTTNTLLRDSVAYTKWISPTESSTPSTATALTYNTNAYGNVTVMAVYGATTGDITITSTTIAQLAHESFSDANVDAYYANAATGAASGTACKNGTITVARGADEQFVYVKVTTNPIFVRYALWVGDVQYDNKLYAESLTFTSFSTSRLPMGSSTCIRVDAYTATGESASASFYINKDN